MADISKISPDNGTTIYNLKDIEARKRVPEVLLKDTVGWVGKNLLNYPVGIRATIASDGTINNSELQYCSDYIAVESLQFIMSCDSKTGSPSVIIGQYTANKTWISRQVNNSFPWSITLDSNTKYIRISFEDNSTDKLTNPMFCKANIVDDTYEPYHKSVEEVVGDIRAEQTVLGAKNLLSKGWVTQTVQGATFTANSDGSVTVDTAGVATTGSAIISKEYTFKAGDKFILSGCPEGGSDNTYRVDITATGFGANDYGEGVAVIIPSDGTYNVRIRVASGATVNNLTFYPMLRLESDPDDTYVPYAMTNREITEELTVQESAVTDIVSGASISNNHNNLYKQGKFVHMCIEIAHVTATAYDTIIAKVPSNYKPRAFTVDCNMSNTQVARIYVDNNGNVKSRNALSDASFVATATWITS